MAATIDDAAYSRGVRERLAHIRERISAACAHSGRAADDVTLVAVTKYIDAAHTVLLAKEGVLHCGENRWQSAQEKVDLGIPVQWHFIGPLQRNKAGKVARHFDWVHSVDRADLAADLSRYATAAGRTVRALLQVNLSGELQKAGVAPYDVEDLLTRCRALPGLSVEGLMMIGRPGQGPAATVREFSALRKLRDGVGPRIGLSLPELSMGMSADYELAIEEGATLVRIGQSLVVGSTRETGDDPRDG